MESVHVEVIGRQIAKKIGKPCGDVYLCERTKNYTTIIICDGLGSGSKANIYATLAASRIDTALKAGFSLRKVFRNMVKTMEESVQKDLPYSAFAICRILNSGVAIILSYEIPVPILISNGYVTPVPARSKTVGLSITTESVVKLQPDDFLLLCSDGITNSGMGNPFTYGWGTERITAFIQSMLNSDGTPNLIADLVIEKSLENDGGKPKDDFTAMLLKIRKGTVINIITGPPADKTKDKFMVNRFLNARGFKIVNGGTTAKIVSTALGSKLTIDQESDSYLTPPSYAIDGIDLVTEGTVTLNQLYNVLDCDPRTLAKNNPVTELLVFILAADTVNFMVGSSINKANSNVAFTQLGIIPRKKIIELLTEELKKRGKTVSIEYY